MNKLPEANTLLACKNQAKGIEFKSGKEEKKMGCSTDFCKSIVYAKGVSLGGIEPWNGRK